MNAYEITIAPSLSARYAALAPPAHDGIARRLAHAAELGMRRGLHRATVGHVWIVFRVDDGQHQLSLISFGDQGAREPSADEQRWENEGGNTA